MVRWVNVRRCVLGIALSSMVAGCGATRSSADNPTSFGGLTPNTPDMEAGLVAIAPGFDIRTYKAVVVEKPADKAADKPAETTASVPTASVPAETKRPAAPRTAKASSPVQPVIAAAPADAAAAVEDRRDANDLARAAIERLRANGEAPKRAQEAPRAPEVARAPEAPRVAPAPPSTTVSALPPPIVIAAPPEVADGKAPYNAASRVEDPLRPTPPAEIPVSRPPLDLRAEVAAEPPKQKTNIGEDMLSAAKSMFHAVLPKPRQTEQ